MNALVETIASQSIFVLEDDPVHRLLLEHEFEADRYSLNSAADATSAMALIANGRNYKVGIFDLKVPIGLGEPPTTDSSLRVITAARNAFPSMVIFTISSIILTEDVKARLKELGVKSILPKPFSMDVLHDLVDSTQ